MDRSDDAGGAARRDPITGLLNRSELDRLRLEDPDAPIGVVYIDVKDFRTYNQEVGMDSGDRAMADIVARLLRTSLPGTTIVRFGGDEFVAVVKGAPVPETLTAQLGAFRQEFTTPSDPKCPSAALSLVMGTADVNSAAELNVCMDIAQRDLWSRK